MDYYTTFCAEFRGKDEVWEALRACVDGHIEDLPEDIRAEIDDDDLRSITSVSLEAEESGRCIVADEYGGPSHLAEIVAILQEYYDDPTPFCIEAAHHGSRTGPDSEGGSAYIVHNGKVKWIGTAAWLDDNMKAATYGYRVENAYVIPYNDLEHLIREHLGIEWDIVAHEEMANDSSKVFVVREPNVHDREVLKHLKNTVLYGATGALLNHLGEKGIIPYGKCVVEVWW